jgi:hypothetical protein
MKAAKFFYFGHVVRDPKPAKPATAYVFIRRLSEAEDGGMVDSLPLPLEAYAAERRQKIRRRRRLDLALESDAKARPIVSNSIELPSNTASNAPNGVQEPQSVSNSKISIVRFLEVV